MKDAICIQSNFENGIISQVIYLIEEYESFWTHYLKVDDKLWKMF